MQTIISQFDETSEHAAEVPTIPSIVVDGYNFSTASNECVCINEEAVWMFTKAHPEQADAVRAAKAKYAEMTKDARAARKAYFAAGYAAHSAAASKAKVAYDEERRIFDEL